ncbi:hypothetical protein DFS34DRAFT_366264 [Phlyctochytrium arcticum]|nr:hypothetical protein DFS34DRAFT_366264 [Phlyctochytrium arcticum]
MNSSDRLSKIDLLGLVVSCMLGGEGSAEPAAKSAKKAAPKELGFAKSSVKFHPEKKSKRADKACQSRWANSWSSEPPLEVSESQPSQDGFEGNDECPHFMEVDREMPSLGQLSRSPLLYSTTTDISSLTITTPIDKLASFSSLIEGWELILYGQEELLDPPQFVLTLPDHSFGLDFVPACNCCHHHFLYVLSITLASTSAPRLHHIHHITPRVGRVRTAAG